MVEITKVEGFDYSSIFHFIVWGHVQACPLASQ